MVYSCKSFKIENLYLQSVLSSWTPCLRQCGQTILSWFASLGFINFGFENRPIYLEFYSNFKTLVSDTLYVDLLLVAFFVYLVPSLVVVVAKVSKAAVEAASALTVHSHFTFCLFLSFITISNHHFLKTLFWHEEVPKVRQLLFVK